MLAAPDYVRSVTVSALSCYRLRTYYGKPRCSVAACRQRHTLSDTSPSSRCYAALPGVCVQAEKFGGRVVVAFEGQDAGGYGQLNDVWEDVGPDDVLTPAEVYANLTSEGFAVKYFRVPVTDGTSPSVGVTRGSVGHCAACRTAPLF